jgi:hypothetical protein
VLSVTGFPSAAVLGRQSSRLPTDYMDTVEVSRRTRRARPCPRHERALAHVANGPHDFASAVLRVYEYYCLRR